MEIEKIKTLLKTLNFQLLTGEENGWAKKYPQQYEIRVFLNTSSPQKSKIDFGEKIKAGRATTANFNQPESLVVFECVDRLLEKGYKPENIILEKSWNLGHKGKGFLDIAVQDENGKSFLMIECKTWGKEYEIAKKQTEKDGGQLFSYLIQEKSTNFACLYSSVIEKNQIKYQNDIIVITDEIKLAENQQEAFESWLPQVFETKGIFEDEIKPYKVDFKGILKKELKSLSERDGGDIFFRFAEILRRNVVSDKTNAFNKIFNLFLCKIVDEFERSEDEEVEFQWKENEKNEEVMLRLNDLYKRGMDLYLGLKIEAVSEKELESELNKTNNGKNIKSLFIRQKLYSGNEFAFKEVFDLKTFNENCIVVKEVVKLLEKYRIKYNTKQQFLGDFFENLLNTGIKQESGQFFTPIPIAQFICKSIPIRKIVEKKNNNREPFFLPYVIDYASGSGHFLTEAMEEIDSCIKNMVDSEIKCGEKYKKEYIVNKNNFLWAREYVYGIEKDYRLAKTTKISTFLNGDGDAKVICADGLDNFSKSEEYKDKLTISDNKENQQFDIVVSNPPYSVDGFKTTLNYGKESFELFPYLSDRSSEIECLFVERTKQLLNIGGVAGVILPITLLINEGVQTKTRELLLKYFDIKAIVELGSNTFMATTQKTFTIFLERRSDDVWNQIENTVNKFFTNFKDISCNNIEKPFSKYAENTLDLSFADYINLLKENITDTIKESILFQEYREANSKLSENQLLDYIKLQEKEKVAYFIATYDKRVVVVKAPEEKTSEKEFLGYEFSRAKGREGIKVYRNKFNNNELTTKLFDENDLFNCEKVNCYILKNYLDELKSNDVHNSLEGIVSVETLHSLLDFNSTNFQKKITTAKKLRIESEFQTEKLHKIYPIVDSGTTAPQDREFFKNGKYPFIRAGNISKKDENNCVIPDKNSLLNDLAIKECALKKFRKGTILFAKSGRSATTNNITRLKEDSFVVNHLACIFTDNDLDLDFLYYFLEYYQTSNLIPLNSDYPTISLKDIRNLPVPLIDEPTKRKIVNKMKAIERENSRDKENKKEAYLSSFFRKIR